MLKKKITSKEIFENEEGKKKILVSRRDFEDLIDRLEVGYDLKIAEERLKKPGKPIPWEHVKKELLGKSDTEK